MPGNVSETDKTLLSTVRIEVMQIIRFGPAGKEKPGLLKGDRIVDLRDIYPVIPDIRLTSLARSSRRVKKRRRLFIQ